MTYKVLGTVLAALLMVGCTLSQTSGTAQTKTKPHVRASLAAHSAVFEKRVEKVTDGVYVAIGYALANSIMLEGDDGVVIVDVTESAKTARAVLEADQGFDLHP